MTEPFVPGLAAEGPAPPRSLCFAVREGEVLVIESRDSATIPSLADLDAETPELYLGDLCGVRCYAVADERESPPDGMRFVPLRPLAGLLDEGLFRVAGRAAQIVEWDLTHRFCGRCGAPTERVVGERARRCTACGHSAYPRVAPAVIVRVTRGDELLLARGRRWSEPIYSLVAGFVEPGESLEETVVREVREEVAIDVAEIRYIASQPWPFPHSLMLGFEARHAGGEIAIDDEELVDAGWFTADRLPRLPPGFSIARALIDDWIASRTGAVRRHESDDPVGVG